MKFRNNLTKWKRYADMLGYKLISLALWKFSLNRESFKAAQACCIFLPCVATIIWMIAETGCYFETHQKNFEFRAKRCMEYQMGRWQPGSTCCYGESSYVYPARYWTRGACCLYCLLVQLPQPSGSFMKTLFFLFTTSTSEWGGWYQPLPVLNELALINSCLTLY